MRLDRYGWDHSGPTCAHGYVVPKLLSLVPKDVRRAVDIGCGNGYVAGVLASRGIEVIGVEPSSDGIERARVAHPGIRFEQGSVDSDLVALVGGTVDLVVATEVIEHLVEPRKLLRAGYALLRSGGRMVITTPYHGYVKNLALSIAGAWDRHFTADWDGGHIKFFSPATLRKMILECGYATVKFAYVGRAPWLWKSMIAIASKA
jgi:2-polyprenyl-6-hydroxyphenyl methylase/3-demethylubiquinone-9 3-methyltransferase